MSKVDSIIDFSIILNRGYGSNDDCSYFDTVNHPQLVTSFIDYVNLNKDYLGLTRIENRQSITDSGCDVFIELKSSVKIGVHVKSKGDVEEKDFSNKVKSQYAESAALGLDKFYILICSPINTTSEKKINYIVSHMATYKTNYHAVLNPNNCIKIFSPGGKMPEAEYSVLKQLYSKEENPANIESILHSIKESLSPKVQTEFGAGLENAINRPPFQQITSARKFIDFLQLQKNTKASDIISAMNVFIDKIGKLSIELRKFFYLIVRESIESKLFLDALEMNLYELQSVLSIDAAILNGKLSILTNAKYQLVELDQDEENVVQVFLSLPGNYNFMKELRNFCYENFISLESILVDGDFSQLD
jgi:hypothetical protein